MWFRLAIAVAALEQIVCPSRADVIFLKDGRRIVGKILVSGERYVVVDSRNQTFDFLSSDVAEARRTAEEPGGGSSDSADGEAKSDQRPKAVHLELVRADGFGANHQQAVSNALLNAVRKTAGSIIALEERQADGRRVSTQTVESCEGYVERWQQVSLQQFSDLSWRATLDVVIRRKALEADLGGRRSLPASRTSLDMLNSQAELAEARDANRASAVRICLRGVPGKLIRVRPLEFDEPRKVGTDLLLRVPIRFVIDQENYREWMERLDQMLGPIAEDSGACYWTVADFDSIPLAGRRTGVNDGFRELARERFHAALGILGMKIPMSDGQGLFLAQPSRLPPRRPRFLQLPRVVAVMDLQSEQTRWWQLPPAAWQEACRCLSEPSSLLIGIGEEGVSARAELDALPLSGIAETERIQLDMSLCLFDGFRAGSERVAILVPRLMIRFDDDGSERVALIREATVPLMLTIDRERQELGGDAGIRCEISPR